MLSEYGELEPLFRDQIKDEPGDISGLNLGGQPDLRVRADQQAARRLARLAGEVIETERDPARIRGAGKDTVRDQPCTLARSGEQVGNAVLEIFEIFVGQVRRAGPAAFVA